MGGELVFLVGLCYGLGVVCRLLWMWLMILRRMVVIVSGSI